MVTCIKPPGYGDTHVLIDQRRHASCDPPTGEEYKEKFARNTVITGTSVHDMMVSTACPCCAEPGFMTYPMARAAQALAQGATCSHCCRTVRQLMLKLPNNSLSYEYLQTGGKDPPPYLPMIRRMEDFK